MSHRIFLIDDHAIIREGLKLLIGIDDQFEVVGEAENGKQALDVLNTIEPDLILLDMIMPIMDGIGFLESYKGNVPVLVLTTVGDGQNIKRAIQLGAKGYLLKDSDRETLYRAMLSAIKGEMLLTKEVTEKLFGTGASNASEAMFDFGLTDRERYVLSCVARGDTNKSIGIELGISERTVKAHLTNIYLKMDVASRSEAVAKAMKNGLVHAL